MRFSIIVCVSILLILSINPNLSCAGLIGDSVSAQVIALAQGYLATDNMYDHDVSTQFISPATVGSGTEFSGVLREAAGNNVGSLFPVYADITVDIGDTGFTVSIAAQSGDLNSVWWHDTDWGIMLSGLTWIPGPDTIVGITTVSDTIGVGYSDASLVQGQAYVEFREVDSIGDSGGTASFSFITAAPSSPVPEPATMLLLGTGLAGLGFIHRRNKA